MIEISEDNPYFCKHEGILYDKNKTKIIIVPSNILCFTIPETVTTISSYSFIRCDKLKSISIPNSVTSIGESCFENCKKLNSVFIGNGVEFIGNNAFTDTNIYEIIYSGKQEPDCKDAFSSSKQKIIHVSSKLFILRGIIIVRIFVFFIWVK